MSDLVWTLAILGMFFEIPNIWKSSRQQLIIDRNQCDTLNLIRSYTKNHTTICHRWLDSCLQFRTALNHIIIVLSKYPWALNASTRKLGEGTYTENQLEHFVHLCVSAHFQIYLLVAIVVMNALQNQQQPPDISEMLSTVQKRGNSHNSFAVAVKKTRQFQCK